MGFGWWVGGLSSNYQKRSGHLDICIFVKLYDISLVNMTQVLMENGVTGVVGVSAPRPAEGGLRSGLSLVNVIVSYWSI